MGDAADDLMHRELDIELGFKEIEKESFRQSIKKKYKRDIRALLRREKEPEDHPFFDIEKQRDVYFKHKGQNGIVDIREIDAGYARNLYNWYLQKHNYDKNLLFMRTLKEIKELEE